MIMLILRDIYEFSFAFAITWIPLVVVFKLGESYYTRKYTKQIKLKNKMQNGLLK